MRTNMRLIKLSRNLALGLGLGLSLGLLASASAFAAESATARHHPKEVEFEFEGPFGTYDRGALQRGFQVYKEVCAACHGLQHIAFRNLADKGGPEFSEAQARALAAAVKVPAEPNDKGETTDESGAPLTRPAVLSDKMPMPYPNENAARANNGGSLPPELSLIVKAREGGPQYVYSLLTGYHEKPAAGFKAPDGKYFNPYFEGWTIGMPPPLNNNGVTYSDGTKATIEQQAHDVVTFLAWTAEPKMEDRKRMGFGVLIFLVALAGILFAVYLRVWKDAH
jgi:ubiquinol-cytochrome c reductase cytochrome b/c1 subunit